VATALQKAQAGLMGDTFDRFTPRQRGLFGENEERHRELWRDNPFQPKPDVVDLTLVLRQERETSIAVTQLDGAGEKWTFLPKSMIDYRKLSATAVEVTLPESLARQKGLI
jgi:hypothetical protein